ncbi:TPA: hypothetical protein ACGO2X_001657 [Streptococcus suis]
MNHLDITLFNFLEFRPKGMVHSRHCAFHISRAQEKIATQGDCAFPVSREQAKKTRQGLDALSHFQAHEKTVHSPVALLIFPERKKKWSTQGDCAFPVSRAQAKKTRQGLDALSHFQAHEKTVHSRTVFLIFVYEW